MVAVRKITNNDISQLVELNLRETFGSILVDALSSYQKWEQGLWWVDYDLLSWYYSCLKDTLGDILVIEHKGKIVAELDYCQSYDNIGDFKGKRNHIIWLVVDPEFRRMGFAETLITHLKNISDNPIWVEAEDERTVNLYHKLGKEIFSISNWKITLEMVTEEIVDSRLNYEVLKLKKIAELPSTYSLLLGRYYAPDYDISQFLASETVKDYMWGNTEIPNIFFFQLQETFVYAVMTQYPRIWVQKGYKNNNLKKIIAAITLYLFEFGYDKIFLQIYNNDEALLIILKELNYTQTIAHDPVFQLN